MKLKDIIRGQKSSLSIGKWGYGHIPRTQFPMSRLKDRRYKYGKEYAWRVVQFDAAGRHCRILIILNEKKEILRARLGVESSGDMIVISDYEFHGSEPGWHCHVATDDHSEISPGAARFNKRKWPTQPSRTQFGATEANALSIVARHFRFEAQGDLL